MLSIKLKSKMDKFFPFFNGLYRNSTSQNPPQLPSFTCLEGNKIWVCRSSSTREQNSDSHIISTTHILQECFCEGIQFREKLNARKIGTYNILQENQTNK